MTTTSARKAWRGLGFHAELSEGNVVDSDRLQHWLPLANERKQEVRHFARLGGGTKNISWIAPHCLQPVLDVGRVILQTFALGHTKFSRKERGGNLGHKLVHFVLGIPAEADLAPVGKFVEERFVIRSLGRESRVVGDHYEVTAAVARPRTSGNGAMVAGTVTAMPDFSAAGLDQFFCGQKNGAGCRCIPVLMDLIIGGVWPDDLIAIEDGEASENGNLLLLFVAGLGSVTFFLTARRRRFGIPSSPEPLQPVASLLGNRPAATEDTFPTSGFENLARWHGGQAEAD